MSWSHELFFSRREVLTLTHPFAARHRQANLAKGHEWSFEIFQVLMFNVSHAESREWSS